MNVHALRTIRNPRAVLKLAKRWPERLAPPVRPNDTDTLARAVSLLAAVCTRDNERVHASDLTPAQARDVVAALQ